MSNKPYATPNLLGDSWDVSASNEAETETKSRKMKIPIHESEAAASMRMHEMLHAAYTPKVNLASVAKTEMVGEFALQVTEDMRLYTLARARAGFDEFPRDPDLWQRIKDAKQQYGVAVESYLAVATKNREDFDFSPEAKSIQELVFAELCKNNSESKLTFQDTIRAAKLLEKLQFVSSPASGEKVLAVDLPPLEFALPWKEANWMPMQIHTPSLSVDVYTKCKAGRTRLKPMEQGEYIVFADRMCEDEAKLFGLARKPPGVSVLVDVSGSMHWCHEQLMQVLTKIPAATIATYSSYQAGNLSIIARRGRMVSEDWHKRGGGGNGCDGPALAWLCRQKGPRYWYSDGGVTGFGDAQCPELFLDVKRLKARGQIKRVMSVEQILNDGPEEIGREAWNRGI